MLRKERGWHCDMHMNSRILRYWGVGVGGRDERNERLRVRRRVLVLVRVDCDWGCGLDLLHGGHDRRKRRSRSAAKRTRVNGGSMDERKKGSLGGGGP